MEGTKRTEMIEQKENDFEKRWTVNIKVVDDSYFHIKDDDPALIRKEQEILKSFQECPPPDFILKRMRGEE